MKTRTLSDWLTWIEKLHPRSIELGLERVHVVLDNMGLRQPRYNVITISGTNGKGSATAMGAAILRRAGYKVGDYTSPHLIKYNERINIDGSPVSDEKLCMAFERIEAARRSVQLTYFEYGTIAALDLFQAAGIDIAVLEVGMGGRLDAVNAIDPDVAIVTTVDIDHTSWLGHSREEIGREKAGIFRRGRPAICGDPDPPRIIAEEAARIGAQFLQINHDFFIERTTTEWNWRYILSGSTHAVGEDSLGVTDQRYRVGLPYPAMRGNYQLFNAASVLMALESIADRFPVTQADVRDGLLATVIPGRFQVLPGRPIRVLDVAHNPQAARALAATLREQPVVGQTFAVIGMLKDKDLESVARVMVDVVDRWFPATLHVPRGATAAQLVEALTAAGANSPIQGYDDVLQAYNAACRDATESDRIVVFGSFYTVGDILASSRKV